MPKIDAPSVAEHRARMQERLVEAAEALLRADEPLTAGAVSKAAGIARNSIYRYVDSVDDLRVLVLSRHLPAWLDAVERATENLPPAERVPVWVEVNLREASVAGHGWLMRAARDVSGTRADIDRAVADAHTSTQAPLVEAWRELTDGEARARMGVALTLGLVDAAFTQLEGDLAVSTVVATTVSAARALVGALAE